MSFFTAVQSADEKILLYLNHLGSTRWDGFWLYMSNQHAWWWFYLLLILLIFYKNKPKNALILTVAVLIALSLNDQMINGIKALTHRLRPCNVPHLKTQLRVLKCSPQFSFFSAHAANSFLVISALFFRLRDHYPATIWLLLFLWAFLTAYSRLYIGIHYPSDVLTGVAEGIISGYLVARLTGRLERR